MQGATIEYKFTLKNGAVEIPAGSTLSLATGLSPVPTFTCTGIARNATGVLGAAFAAYASAECTFTRAVPAKTNLAAVQVTASVTPSVATFPAVGGFPVVPVHTGNPTLQVSNAVTSTNAADYVDGERWCCPSASACVED
jgi:hypothetical protein